MKPLLVYLMLVSCAKAYCCTKNHVSVVVPAFPQQLVNFKLPEASEDGFFEKCGNLQQTTSIVVVQCCVSSPTSVHNLDQSMTTKASSTIKKV
jgi:hypothetical protein